MTLSNSAPQSLNSAFGDLEVHWIYVAFLTLLFDLLIDIHENAVKKTPSNGDCGVIPNRYRVSPLTEVVDYGQKIQMALPRPWVGLRNIDRNHLPDIARQERL